MFSKSRKHVESTNQILLFQAQRTAYHFRGGSCVFFLLTSRPWNDTVDGAEREIFLSYENYLWGIWFSQFPPPSNTPHPPNPGPHTSTLPIHHSPPYPSIPHSFFPWLYLSANPNLVPLFFPNSWISRPFIISGLWGISRMGYFSSGGFFHGFVGGWMDGMRWVGWYR